MPASAKEEIANDRQTREASKYCERLEKKKFFDDVCFFMRLYFLV
jgi:hypothetical protein